MICVHRYNETSYTRSQQGMITMMLNIGKMNVDDLVVFVSFLIDITVKRYIDYSNYIDFLLEIMNFNCSVPSNF